MIEPYQWLLSKVDELGFKRENVGPSSVDLELGEVIKWKRGESISHTGNIKGETELSETFPFYTLFPKIFYLCSTREYIRVPNTHCAFINMRSSLARRGLGHKMAGFIDPGFEGQVTLELTADIPVEVKRFERIVQIIYMRLSEETVKPYRGKYLGQVGPTEAYQG